MTVFTPAPRTVSGTSHGFMLAESESVFSKVFCLFVCFCYCFVFLHSLFAMIRVSNNYDFSFSPLMGLGEVWQGMSSGVLQSS